MHIQPLTPDHATPYRALMLEAYELHPDAFTSSASERAALPLMSHQRCGFVQDGVEPFAVAVAGHCVSKVHMWCPVQPLPGHPQG